MSTLHAPASCFNPIQTAVGNPDLATDGGDVFDEAFGTSYAHASGFPDESIVDLSDDDTRAQLEAGIVEWERDNAIQLADEAHADTLRQAIAKAKELYGNGRVRLQRCYTVGGEGNPIRYYALIDGPRFDMPCGTGDTPEQAVENIGPAIDEKYGVAAEFSGYVVDRVAYIAGGDFRTSTEAQQLARRIALDVTYLDTLMELHIEGVYDLRQRATALAA